MPTTLAQALETAAERLTGNTETPGLDAEVLLMHVLDRDRAYLRAWPDRELTPQQARRFHNLLMRRTAGFPVAYLVGKREFWSRAFVVRPGVLIPRPDTELLIELALDGIPAHRAADILELGTGSGIIAVTLAAERPQSRIVATDLSQEALTIAQHNARRLGAAHIRFSRGNWFEPLSENECFDLIVSNPPYIAEQDPHLTQGDLRFEPLLALASGPQGLDALRAIAEGARRHLKPEGLLLLEHGYDQDSALAAILAELGYSRITHHRDLQGHRRATMARYP